MHLKPINCALQSKACSNLHLFKACIVVINDVWLMNPFIYLNRYIRSNESVEAALLSIWTEHCEPGISLIALWIHVFYHTIMQFNLMKKLSSTHFLLSRTNKPDKTNNEDIDDTIESLCEQNIIVVCHVWLKELNSHCDSCRWTCWIKCRHYYS